MPRLSKSDRAKVRVTHLVGRLLAYANHELAEELNLKQTVIRWVDQHTANPKLRVQTTLKELMDLASVELSKPPNKEQIRESLHLLKSFLYILEDNRTQTQGAEIWRFTLNLWYSSTAENLTALAHHWDQQKFQPLNRSSRSKTRSKPEQPQVVPPSHSSSISQTPDLSKFRHNLPACDYRQFIGREQELIQLCKFLDPHHPVARISITGVNGVGKTSLILEVAHRLIRHHLAPIRLEFDVIIFTSSKPQRFTNHGILPHLRPERKLDQICRSILSVLDSTDLFKADLADQIDYIHDSFTCRQVLLIVDNLETIEEEASVLAFLYDLPVTAKVVITSCQRTILDNSAHIDLEPLSKAEGLAFIQQQAQIKTVSLAPAEADALYNATGGIPPAIIYAMGQLADGFQLNDALPRLTLASEDYCRFYFERSIEPLRGQFAHYLLMTLALFPKPTRKDTLAQIALPHSDLVTDLATGLARLHQLSLITIQAEQYTILSLTREFALAELQANFEFESAIRTRWVNWYLKFCQQQGHLNWKEWHEYQDLDQEWENVQAVVEWCIEQDRYEDFCSFWQYIKGYMHLYGYGSDRLRWMQWWIEATRQRSDKPMLAQALRDHAWTLTLMDKPDYRTKAAQLLQQAWELRNETDLQFQLELSLEQAILCIVQDQLTTAQLWLEQSKNLLPQVPLLSSEQQRYSIRLDYYEAEVWCKQGENERSKALFHQVLQEARSINWIQVEIYSLNWLSEIALSQTELDQAEVWLSQNLPIVQKQRDKRSIAFHQRSWSRLERLRGNEAKAQQWAQAAMNNFTQLGMEEKAQEMRNWLVSKTDPA